MNKHTFLFLELLQDNDGEVYFFMYNLSTHKCASFKFWEILEVMDQIRVIIDIGFIPDCDNCPHKEDYDEGTE